MGSALQLPKLGFVKGSARQHSPILWSVFTEANQNWTIFQDSFHRGNTTTDYTRIATIGGASGTATFGPTVFGASVITSSTDTHAGVFYMSTGTPPGMTAFTADEDVLFEISALCNEVVNTTKLIGFMDAQTNDLAWDAGNTASNNADQTLKTGSAAHLTDATFVAFEFDSDGLAHQTWHALLVIDGAVVGRKDTGVPVSTSKTDVLRIELRNRYPFFYLNGLKVAEFNTQYPAATQAVFFAGTENGTGGAAHGLFVRGLTIARQHTIV